MGDVRDDHNVREALTGCSGVYVSLQGHTEEEFERVEHKGTARVARLAAQTGVNRVIYLSGALASAKTAYHPQQRAKWQAEQALERASVPFTIFKPTFFMETLALSV